MTRKPMFFGVAITVTPQEFIRGLLFASALIIGLVILFFLSSLIPSTAPNPLAVKLQKAVEAHQTISAEFSDKERQGRAAILDSNTTPINITAPPDLRVRFNQKLTVKNVTDQEARGAVIHVLIKSDSLPNHFIETDLTRDFKPPLSPGESGEIEWQMSGASITTLSSDLFDPVSHDTLVGTHKASGVELTLTAIKVRGRTAATPKIIFVGPTDDQRAKFSIANDRIEKCAQLIQTTNNQDTLEFEFTEAELANNKDCLLSL